MKLVTFSPPDQGPRVGALVEDHVIDLLAASGDDPSFATMLGLVAAGPSSLGLATKLCADLSASLSTGVAAPGYGEGGPSYPLSSVRTAAPIPRPAKNVFCVGLNYRSHVEQNARALGQPIEIPTIPLFFSKPVTAVIGPGDAVLYDPRLTNKLDFEIELAVVIGKQGKWIAPEDAHKHIFGFTIVNDVSARDLQWRTSQFFYGKGQDSYCPMGAGHCDRRRNAVAGRGCAGAQSQRRTTSVGAGGEHAFPTRGCHRRAVERDHPGAGRRHQPRDAGRLRLPDSPTSFLVPG